MVTAPAAPPGFLGRARERQVLDQVLANVRGGQSAALVIHGEAGIGKTALLQYAAQHASGFRVAQIAGVEAEMELPFAAVHQLCAPMFDHLDDLPQPQQDALRVALGVTIGDTPNRFLVAVAILGLLAAAAKERPLLCAVDDAQWLDAASGQVLGFVARRLLAESVAMIFAVRNPTTRREFDGLRELELEGLDVEDARALLATTVPGQLDGRVRDRIVAETRGNPLALLELPRGLTPTQLAGGFGLLHAQRLTDEIEETFSQRLDAVSDDARRLLLLAAAEPVGDPLLLRRASQELGIAVQAVNAETDGLLSIGERVTFRHPLVRSAVYQSSPIHDRRAIHLALAEATDGELDPDRRAWHRASAAAEPDEQVASELERSAGRARDRGGVAASAAFLQRAVVLTQDPTRRAERALAAAEASLQAGSFDEALGCLATADVGALDEFQGGRVDLLRGQIAFAMDPSSDAAGLLLKAAKRLEPHDLNLARETYLTAWGAAVVRRASRREDVLVEICHAIQELPAGPAPRPIDVLLTGLAQLITDGHAAAAPTLQGAAKALAAMPVEDVMRWGWMAPIATSSMWDHEGYHEICMRQLRLVRAAGALADLPIYLAQLGLARVWMGDFTGTAALVAETDSVTAATGSRFAPYALLRLRALKGNEAEASATIAGVLDETGPGGKGMAAHAHWAAAVLYNGLARYADAVSEARQVTSNVFEPWIAMWTLPELVEAAARVGDAELARDAFRRLSETTQPCATDFAVGIEARCRALVTDGAAADQLYGEAIDRLRRTTLRPELARAELLYGEWLRRENRRSEARAQLRAAYDQLTAIGMEAFAERARRELLATGEKVRKRNVEMRDELTAQERQIALLARDGLSNPEIGARLFLSPRTVEWHLHHVFAKLGIRSRLQLVSALPASDADVVLT